MSVHCLIMEDDKNTASFIRKGLAEVGYAVTCCSNSLERLQIVSRRRWDIIIVGGMSDNCDGRSLIKTLRELDKNTPVLILISSAMLGEHVQELCLLGHDYLAKPFAFSHLLGRVEALTGRSLQLQQRGELQVADLKLYLQSRRAERAGIPISLQPREFRLLEYLVRHQNQIVTRTILLESVWDERYDPNGRVLDVGMSRLRRKIEKGFSRPLIHTKRGVGYMVSVSGESPNQCASSGLIVTSNKCL